MPLFDRDLAFSRNIGFVTRAESAQLAQKTVAIAGLGGVGGHYLLTLSRLGVGGYRLAEFDTFGVENFNRQVGATVSSVGRKKLDVMREMALQINPDLRMTSFAEGVTPENVDQFLDGADLYVDGLDFFAFKARSLVFKKCREKGIPAVTSGPIGMGAALMNFLPGKMSFHDYFQWKETDSELELGVKFLVGLAPKLPHRTYLVDPTALNLKARKGPSTPMGCELCSAVVGTEALKILLGRGRVFSAPRSVHYDAYRNHLFLKYIAMGNRNPLQRLKISKLIKIFETR